MEPQQFQDELSGEVSRPIRILLVDDNVRFVELVATLLRVDPRFEIVGQALSGREALIETNRLQPDLILMDIAMPDLDGLTLTRHFKNRPAAPRIIIMTTYADPEYRQAAQATNADGFLAKADLGLKLLPTIYALF